MLKLAVGFLQLKHGKQMCLTCTNRTANYSMAKPRQIIFFTVKKTTPKPDRVKVPLMYAAGNEEWRTKHFV